MSLSMMRWSLACVLGAMLVCVLGASAAPAPFRVRSLPGWSQPLTDEMYTGYLPLDDGAGSQIFYWLSMARNTATVATDTPVVLWLQGGPGCSGGVGWFLENGPFNLDAQQNLHFNPHSWSTNAHFLFVDQPIGTGLSTLSGKGGNDTYPTTIEQSTAQLYRALQGFYAQHPQLRRNPFFITGESYAGKYIPYLATAILEGQREFKLNLAGIAIGNGWVDPLLQTSVYGAHAYNLGMIDENQRAQFDLAYNNCSHLVHTQQWRQADRVCNEALDAIVAQAGDINVDDLREFGDDEPDDRLGVYFSNPAVAAALGLDLPAGYAYSSCSEEVADALSADEMMSSVHLLPGLISALPMVYLYEGIFDLNCGVVGVEAYLKKLLPEAYPKAQRSLWLSPTDGSMSGYVKPILPSLTFIVVQGAGHMTPKTQPASSLDMLTHLLTATPFPMLPQRKLDRTSRFKTQARRQRQRTMDTKRT